MSRASVRHITAAYIADANITGIGTVFASPPKISSSTDRLANVPPGTESGSVLYVEVLHSSEVRVAEGGPVAGKKMVTQDIRLHLLFRSRQLAAEDAMDDHDQEVEDILQVLRADRTLGTTPLSLAPIFQAGEGPQGITVDTGMPKETGTGSVVVWSVIDLQVEEFITA